MASTSERLLAGESGALGSATACSPVLGEDIRYRVYLPAGYEANQSEHYAVVYLLHGRGDDLDAWTRVAPLLDELILRGVIPPVLMVMPDAPWSDGGSWYVDSAYAGVPAGRPVETALVDDLVAHVDASYRTRADRDHRVIGGYSMGGYGALRYLLAHPDVFSGGLVLSPAAYVPLPPADSSARAYGAFGRDDQVFVDAAYEALSYPALLAEFDPTSRVRLFLAVGDQEWSHPRRQDHRHDLDLVAPVVHNAAKRVEGVASRLRVLAGGHDWSVWEPAFVEGLPIVLGGEVAA